MSARSDRITFALRQAALMGLALLVAGLVTERLHPVEGVSRGIVTTIFLWAIVVWVALLLFHASAFTRSRIRGLEAWPLYGALGIGAVSFLIGLFALDGGNAARRIAFLFATALGTVMFWWAVLGLGYLVAERLRDASESDDVDVEADSDLIES